MQKLLDELRERLLAAGVAPRHARRYIRELADHAADLSAEEQAKGSNVARAHAVALERLGSVDELARAMLAQPGIRSWCARAPWAFFSLAPLTMLMLAYGVALLVLWTGWLMFLPDAKVPFVRLPGGFGVVYFGVGRMLYYTAPVLIGWWCGAIAVRQRLSLAWPAVGTALIAILAASMQVHAYRGGTGRIPHVSLGVSLPWSAAGAHLAHALVILLLATAPLALWRAYRASVRTL